MRIEGVFFEYFHTGGECEFREKNREFYFFVYTPRSEHSGEELYHFCDSEDCSNLSRGRSPCQRVNHVKSGVIYFSAFIFSYDTIHVSGTIHTWNRGLTSGIRA